jgi:hypothetical protein
MKFCWAVRKEGTDTIGISQLVDLTHIPRRSVDRALASLKSRGLLKVTGSVKKPRLYEVLMPKTMQESYAIAVAQEAGSVAPTIGASLTPKLWRTPKNRESGKLRIVE